MDCEQAEVAVEKQRRGALEAGEASALAAHLASCTACSRFVVFSERITRLMADMVLTPQRRLQRRAFERRLNRQQLGDMGPWASYALLASTLALSAEMFVLHVRRSLQFGIQAKLIAICLIVQGIASVVLCFGISLRYYRQAHSSQNSLIEQYRRKLEWEPMFLRLQTVGIGCLYASLVVSARDLGYRPAWIPWVALGVVLGIGGGMELRIRKVRRDLAALDEELP